MTRPLTRIDVQGLAARVDALIAESRFSGVVRVDRGGETVLERSAGWAHRAHRVPMTVDTRLAMASGSKGLTALVVMSLAADGTLPLATRARELLGGDLPLVDDRVTVEHLLAHRSGIGDYLDENAGHQIDDYVMAVPVHTLAESNDYLAVLDGHPQAFAPGERFAYNNAGFVVLAILAERATGTAFADLVQQRVCAAANMTDTEYLRSDDAPGADRTGVPRRRGSPQQRAAPARPGQRRRGRLHHRRRRSPTVGRVADRRHRRSSDARRSLGAP